MGIPNLSQARERGGHKFRHSEFHHEALYSRHPRCPLRRDQPFAVERDLELQQRIHDAEHVILRGALQIDAAPDISGFPCITTGPLSVMYKLWHAGRNLMQNYIHFDDTAEWSSDVYR
jgi:hypothetical protein